MVRFEKVDGYNAIKDNEEQEYTLAQYEPKEYSSSNIDELCAKMNELNNEVLKLHNQIAYMQSKIEEDE